MARYGNPPSYHKDFGDQYGRTNEQAQEQTGLFGTIGTIAGFGLSIYAFGKSLALFRGSSTRLQQVLGDVVLDIATEPAVRRFIAKSKLADPIRRYALNTGIKARMPSRSEFFGAGARTLRESLGEEFIQSTKIIGDISVLTNRVLEQKDVRLITILRKAFGEVTEDPTASDIFNKFKVVRSWADEIGRRGIIGNVLSTRGLKPLKKGQWFQKIVRDAFNIKKLDSKSGLRWYKRAGGGLYNYITDYALTIGGIYAVDSLIINPQRHFKHIRESKLPWPLSQVSDFASFVAWDLPADIIFRGAFRSLGAGMKIGKGLTQRAGDAVKKSEFFTALLDQIAGGPEPTKLQRFAGRLGAAARAFVEDDYTKAGNINKIGKPGGKIDWFTRFIKKQVMRPIRAIKAASRPDIFKDYKFEPSGKFFTYKTIAEERFARAGEGRQMLGKILLGDIKLRGERGGIYRAARLSDWLESKVKAGMAPSDADKYVRDIADLFQFEQIAKKLRAEGHQQFSKMKDVAIQRWAYRKAKQMRIGDGVFYNQVRKKFADFSYLLPRNIISKAIDIAKQTFNIYIPILKERINVPTILGADKLKDLLNQKTIIEFKAGDPIPFGKDLPLALFDYGFLSHRPGTKEGEEFRTKLLHELARTSKSKSGTIRKESITVQEVLDRYKQLFEKGGISSRKFGKKGNWLDYAFDKGIFVVPDAVKIPGVEGTARIHAFGFKNKLYLGIETPGPDGRRMFKLLNDLGGTDTYFGQRVNANFQFRRRGISGTATRALEAYIGYQHELKDVDKVADELGWGKFRRWIHKKARDLEILGVWGQEESFMNKLYRGFLGKFYNIKSPQMFYGSYKQVPKWIDRIGAGEKWKQWNDILMQIGSGDKRAAGKPFAYHLLEEIEKSAKYNNSDYKLLVENINDAFESTRRILYQNSYRVTQQALKNKYIRETIYESIREFAEKHGDPRMMENTINAVEKFMGIDERQLFSSDTAWQSFRKDITSFYSKSDVIEHSNDKFVKQILDNLERSEMMSRTAAQTYMQHPLTHHDGIRLNPLDIIKRDLMEIAMQKGIDSEKQVSFVPILNKRLKQMFTEERSITDDQLMMLQGFGIKQEFEEFLNKIHAGRRGLYNKEIANDVMNVAPSTDEIVSRFKNLLNDTETFNILGKIAGYHGGGAMPTEYTMPWLEKIPWNPFSNVDYITLRTGTEKIPLAGDAYNSILKKVKPINQMIDDYGLLSGFKKDRLEDEIFQYANWKIAQESFTAGEAIAYSLLERPARLLEEFFGLGWNRRGIQSAYQLGKKWFWKAVKIGGAITAWNLMDAIVDESGLFEGTAIGEGTNAFIAGQAVAFRTNVVSPIFDMLGVTDAFKWAKRTTPGSTGPIFGDRPPAFGFAAMMLPFIGAAAAGLPGAAVGILASAATGFGLFDLTKTQEELKAEYSGRKEVPIRHGRWWEFGRTPYEGGRIDYFLPNWYARMRAAPKFTESLYGSKLEYFANHPSIGPLIGLGPLNLFGSTYHWEDKHYLDRPYPVTGAYGSDMPFIGPTFAATIGKILKPQQYMHQVEMARALTSAIPHTAEFKQRGISNIYELSGQYQGLGYENLPPPEEVTPLPGPTITTTSAPMALRMGIYKNIVEFPGLPGFIAETIGEKITGERLMPEWPLLESADWMTSMTQEYWERSLGGGLGTTELLRRFIPRVPRNQMNFVNPIRNKMPHWMPDSSYFIDFQHGDPFSKISNGEARLPGQGYESLHDVQYSFPIGASMYGRSIEEMVNYWLGIGNIDAEKSIEIMDKGTQIGNWVAEQLGRSNMLVKAEAEVWDPREQISGRVDVVIKNPQTGVIYPTEVKSMSSKKFQSAVENGKPYAPHISQVNFYMYAMGKKYGYLLYVNRDTGETHWFPQEYDPYLMERNIRQLEIARQVAEDLTKAGYNVSGEGYSIPDQLKILSDVAPWSEDFKQAKHRAQQLWKMGLLRDFEKLKVETALQQRAAVISKYRFTPERFGEEYPVMDLTINRVTGPAHFTTKEFPAVTHVIPGVDLSISALTEKNQMTIQEAENVRAEAKKYLKETLIPGTHIRGRIAYDQYMQEVYPEKGIQLATTVEGRDVTQELMDIGAVQAEQPGPLDAQNMSLAQRALGTAWEQANKMIAPISPLHTKLLQTKSPIEHYKTMQAYGRESAFWQHPYRDFIEPYMSEAAAASNPVTAGIGGGVLGAFISGNPLIVAGLGATSAIRNIINTDKEKIPEYRRTERRMREYFDILEFEKARRMGDISGMKKTMIGVSPTANPYQIIEAMPKPERDYILPFMFETRPGAQSEIRKMGPEYMNRILDSQWSKTAGMYQHVSAQKALETAMQISKDIVENGELPGSEWKGWDPDIPIHGVKLKTLQTAGLDLHDFNMGWRDDRNLLRMMPNLPSVQEGMSSAKSPGMNDLQSGISQELSMHGIQSNVMIMDDGSPGITVEVNITETGSTNLYENANILYKYEAI